MHNNRTYHRRLNTTRCTASWPLRHAALLNNYRLSTNEAFLLVILVLVSLVQRYVYTKFQVSSVFPIWIRTGRQTDGVQRPLGTGGLDRPNNRRKEWNM